MKLSLAALLISQNVVPVVLSKERPTAGTRGNGDRWTLHDLSIADFLQATTTENEHKHRRILTNKKITERKLLKRSSSGVLKNAPSTMSSQDYLLCDPTLTDDVDDADIGILSCGTDRWCRPSTGSALGGVCTSIMPAPAADFKEGGIASHMAHLHVRQEHSFHHMHAGRVPCNPSTTIDQEDLYECDEDEFCKMVPSGEGGYCVPKTNPPSRRHLLHINDGVTLCDPTSMNFDESCDCSGADQESGTGSVVCLETKPLDFTLMGCGEYVQGRSYVYTFERHMLTEISICDEIKGGYDRTTCILLHSANDCTFVFNDQICTSCAITESFYNFDCSNVEGGMAGDASEDLFTVINQCKAKYQGSSSCTNLCGQGWEIPEEAFDLNVTMAGYGMVSCAYLWFAEEMKDIPDSYCDDYSKAALSGCCLPTNVGPTRQDLWADKIPNYSGGVSPVQLSLPVQALCGLAFLGSLA